MIYVRSVWKVAKVTSYFAIVGGTTAGLLIAYAQFSVTPAEQPGAVLTGIILGTLIFFVSYSQPE